MASEVTLSNALGVATPGESPGGGVPLKRPEHSAEPCKGRGLDGVGWMRMMMRMMMMMMMMMISFPIFLEGGSWVDLDGIGGLHGDDVLFFL